jgi:hypothetical protein
MDEFDEFTRGALARAGLHPTAADLQVLRAVAEAFEPGARALDAVDLAELAIEHDLDPSRPPAPSGTA